MALWRAPFRQLKLTNAWSGGVYAVQASPQEYVPIHAGRQRRASATLTEATTSSRMALFGLAPSGQDLYNKRYKKGACPCPSLRARPAAVCSR